MIEAIAHTADVRFRISASSLDNLFSEGLRALTGFMNPYWLRASASVEIEIEARDRTSLLIDFLNEALTKSHVRREAYDTIEFHSLEETSLRATLHGAAAESFEEDVKAVTYHEAELVQQDGVWSTMLVLDI